ncbi:MAG: Aquaporin Z [uncultured Rubrobacteraceae bacterium]|uniref:Aquaporin Z n=1 Tax=uncultured Rubrobacteraceae bacterium TaxID=349277 RepID=A0A6J4R9E7_9ACTN|nr:MAG: Aquaporin Z [uncultured Rubrobacteraceae bacterium]
MSDRGGREDDLNWDFPQRGGGTRRDRGYGREDGPLGEEPFAGGRGAEPTPSGRGSGQAGRGGAHRSGGRQRSGSGSGRGLYGSEIGSNVLPAAVAELIGTFILVYTGTAVVVAAVLERPITGSPYDSLAIPLAFGLVLVALVAALGHISGAHLNPAITLGLAVTRKFPWNFVPVYIGAQLLGAILAAVATWITFGAEARNQVGLASPATGPGVGFLQAILVEIFVTFILVFVVISVATDDRAPAGVAPIAVGFALAAAIFIAGPTTGAAVNPARALGPIIVAWNNWDLALIYIIGPIIGGILAAVLYDNFVSRADAPG